MLFNCQDKFCLYYKIVSEKICILVVLPTPIPSHCTGIMFSFFLFLSLCMCVDVCVCVCVCFWMYYCAHTVTCIFQ